MGRIQPVLPTRGTIAEIVISDTDKAHTFAENYLSM